MLMPDASVKSDTSSSMFGHGSSSASSVQVHQAEKTMYAIQNVEKLRSLPDWKQHEILAANGPIPGLTIGANPRD